MRRVLLGVLPLLTALLVACGGADADPDETACSPVGSWRGEQRALGPFSFSTEQLVFADGTGVFQLTASDVLFQSLPPPCELLWMMTSAATVRFTMNDLTLDLTFVDCDILLGSGSDVVGGIYTAT